MAVPMLVDLYYGNSDWKTFFLCILTTAFFGGALVLSNAGDNLAINPRQGFMMIALSWILLCVFAALPFWLSTIGLSFTDAIFESVSGLTTTGSTIMVGLEKTPPGILIWRAILQWLGGIGIILMALSVMPFLKVGGMQLFRTELSENEKALPRTAEFAKSIGWIYVVLTFVCAVAYHMTGMTVFDAFAHSLTTISTGGFSTYDTSFSHYDTPWTESVAITFMIVGGLPFILYLKAVRGNAAPLLHDAQVRWFFSILIASTFALFCVILWQTEFDSAHAILKSAFNATSIMTGTGYVSDDYQVWGGFAMNILFFLMVVGGCAGSTSCGIKIFRFQVLYAVTDIQIKKLMHPHGVFIPHYGNKPLPEGVPSAVMSFFFMYSLCFAGLAMALSFVGLDFLTAMSGAATAISNVGPGLGDIIGPTGTFQPLPDSAKWILSAGMILGRLEIFTILVMLSPNFWRR
ncbi:MAG: TrkH family potassium uptake protein [Rhodospirillales bacterium]|nr:TrkH family potassium uptake protein [Rhodospirillales bacterium]MCB9995457.1 TrkH family potassium uptake protein [Rhodospirillales bacterium]